MNWFFITLFYSGLTPKAPGTAGSIVALPFGILILLYFGADTLFLATILITLIAIKMINIYESKSGIHDDKRIVIDELAGVWIALCFAPGALQIAPENLFELENGFLIQSLLALLLFRVYDIKKPSLIGRVDREVNGGIGVMGDDILAGIAAGITTAILWQAYTTIF